MQDALVLLMRLAYDFEQYAECTSLPLIVGVSPLDHEISTRQKVKHNKAAVNGNRRQNYRQYFFMILLLYYHYICIVQDET